MPVANFGSTCSLPANFTRTMLDETPLGDVVLAAARAREDQSLRKQMSSRRGTVRGGRMLGIPKLDDANLAGGPRSADCTLILTEGDSAKALAVAGVSVVGRDKFGIFPLRGKLLNVREASARQVGDNAETNAIRQILNLQHGKEYDSTQGLRYGRVMLMTDQDHDGSHIKGLIINMFHTFWPSLLRQPGFLHEFATPIVKAKHKRKKKAAPESFFTLAEYRQWLNRVPDREAWGIKYYKGLGTSSAAEAREYFRDLDRHTLEFQWDAGADDCVDLAFSKRRSDDRKTWLQAASARLTDDSAGIDHSQSALTVGDFFNKELVLFSLADNVRSLPSVVDGLKPTQRKILHAAFQRNLRQEIKVAQFAGYVSENTAYHHGEASLMGAIVGMAQNYVGSNNVNLLEPSGQFGTRLEGGKDAASPRYIFTRLSPAARAVFPEADDAVLEYLEDDGQRIEPVHFSPVIPHVLVNGAEGIGTGWSTLLAPYNPLWLVQAMRKRLDDAAYVDAVAAGDGEAAPAKAVLASETRAQPWFRGFRGTIERDTGKTASKSKTTGQRYGVLGSGYKEETKSRGREKTSVVIKELPVGVWTESYKTFLHSMMAGGKRENLVESFREEHSEETVHFDVLLTDRGVAEVGKAGVESTFKLRSKLAPMSNVHLFGPDGSVRRYESVSAIISDFFAVRWRLYESRKRAGSYPTSPCLAFAASDTSLSLYLSICFSRNRSSPSPTSRVPIHPSVEEERLEAEVTRIDAQHRFVSDVVGGSLDLKGMDFSAAIDTLDERGFPRIGPGATGFEYLTNMPMSATTRDRLGDLSKRSGARKALWEEMKSKTPKDLWQHDLDAVEATLKDSSK